MTQTPRLEEVIESGINERLRSFFTALPGEIVSYDSTTQKATVKITVTNAIEDSKGDKVWHTPIIQNVPVQFPGSGSVRITFPLGKGDKVIYLVSTLSLVDWLNKGSAELDVDPVSFNNLASGWIVPGINTSPPTDAPTDAMVLHGDTIRLGGSDADTKVALKSDLDDFMTALHTAFLTSPISGAEALAALETALTDLHFPRCANNVRGK